MTLDEVSLDVALGRLAGLRHVGAGPKVIALHGWLDNAASFIPLAEHLPEELDLLALDLPGHGQSDHLGPGADYNWAMAINAVLDAADALGWEQFALLGHSMGAGISTVMAAALPQRVQRVFAIEGLGALSEAVERSAVRAREAIAAMRALNQKQLRVFPNLDVPTRARMQVNRIGDQSARLLVERGVRLVEDGYVWSTDPRMMLPSLTRAVEPQVQDLLAGIECPVRVVYGTPAEDSLSDAVRQQRCARLRYGEVFQRPGNHYLHMEHPEQVAQLATPFLLSAS